MQEKRSLIPPTTPVLFLTFNRPDTTARVFEEIRKAAPVVIAPDIRKQLIALVSHKKYSAYFGEEKKGLIAACMLAKKFSAPLIYFNLELHMDDFMRKDLISPEALFDDLEFRYRRSKINTATSPPEARGTTHFSILCAS